MYINIININLLLLYKISQYYKNKYIFNGYEFIILL